MATLNWARLRADLRGDDLDRSLAATEQIVAHMTNAELHHVYALAEDEDYFVRVMAGEILTRTAGIAALATLLRIMRRNEAEGFDNDGLDITTGDLIAANPITAQPILESLQFSHDPTDQAMGKWGLEWIPPHPTPSLATVVGVTPRPAMGWQKGCLVRTLVILMMVAVAVWAVEWEVWQKWIE